jgi:hypothetical protein
MRLIYTAMEKEKEKEKKKENRQCRSRLSSLKLGLYLDCIGLQARAAV